MNRFPRGVIPSMGIGVTTYLTPRPFDCAQGPTSLGNRDRYALDPSAPLGDRIGFSLCPSTPLGDQYGYVHRPSALSEAEGSNLTERPGSPSGAEGIMERPECKKKEETPNRRSPL
jgi:hypothetical protein